jgi:hypothetical protein
METLPYISKIPCSLLQGASTAGSQPGEHCKQKMVGRKIERLEEKGARLSQARFNFWL